MLPHYGILSFPKLIRNQNWKSSGIFLLNAVTEKNNTKYNRNFSIPPQK